MVNSFLLWLLKLTLYVRELVYQSLLFTNFHLIQGNIIRNMVWTFSLWSNKFSVNKLTKKPPTGKMNRYFGHIYSYRHKFDFVFCYVFWRIAVSVLIPSNEIWNNLLNSYQRDPDLWNLKLAMTLSCNIFPLR